jgi:hypothetical protein
MRMLRWSVLCWNPCVDRFVASNAAVYVAWLVRVEPENVSQRQMLPIAVSDLSPLALKV